VVIFASVVALSSYVWLQADFRSVSAVEVEQTMSSPRDVAVVERILVTNRVEKVGEVGEAPSALYKRTAVHWQHAKSSSWDRPSPPHRQSIKVEMDDPVEPFEGAGGDFFTKKGEE